MDESGDLGFTEKSSKYFIVGYVIADCPHRVSVEVKRLFKKLNLRHDRVINEFKFSNDSDFVRNKFMNLISKLEIDAGQIVIKKTSVASHLKENKPRLYNFVIAEYIMRDVMASYTEVDHINLHLDLSMSKKSREEFNRYFADKISWKTFINGNERLISNKVSHDHSHHEPCLQVADYLAGSLFQGFEHENSKYYELIKSRVKHTHGWGV